MLSPGLAVCPWAMHLTSLSLFSPVCGEAASILRAQVRSKDRGVRRGGEEVSQRLQKLRAQGPSLPQPFIPESFPELPQPSGPVSWVLRRSP